jgi:hypothetical protein
MSKSWRLTATATASSRAAANAPHPPGAERYPRTRLGVEGPLPLRSRGPSTPHAQQPDLAPTGQLLLRPSGLVLRFFLTFDEEWAELRHPCVDLGFKRH